MRPAGEVSLQLEKGSQVETVTPDTDRLALWVLSSVPGELFLHSSVGLRVQSS